MKFMFNSRISQITNYYTCIAKFFDLKILLHYLLFGSAHTSKIIIVLEFFYFFNQI